VVDLRTEAVVSVEALLRWHHPERGFVLPGEFIDVAEQRGLIREIGEWVLRRACTQAAAWRGRFGDGAPRVAVNVSTRQLGNAGLTTAVRGALAGAALPPDWLCLEVTESQLLMVGTSATTDLRTLSEVGVRLAVDDFGTGHSGFDYLRRMPAGQLKIDKSFVDGLGIDATNTAITASVVALAHSLGLDVVAEGVERAAQRDALLEIGCVHGQGWLWYRAMPPEEIDDLLRRPSTTPTS
jgi:EAL domain-containing protein (putative c-di-GMP-specific phosphodiesterase class I)